MGLLIWLYHFLSTFIFFFTFVTYSSAQFCPLDQKSALLQIKSLFNCRSDSKIKSWKNETDCCSWNGISCDHSNVIGVDLSGVGLCGTLHSNSSLFLLTHLQKLNLDAEDGSDFDINGSFVGRPRSRRIPPALGHLKSLTYLMLIGFTGAVPQEISRLSKLVGLALSGSDLSFDTLTIKRLVQNITNIEEMYLYMDLSKVAPSAFMNLSSSLTTLDLSGCGLGGEFPVNVMKLPNLQNLFLSYNPMAGHFPHSNWSSPLKIIEIVATQFSGVIPESIGNLKSLESLTLGEYFIGELPKSIGNLRSLKRLVLNGHFTGKIPTSLGNLTQLTELDLSHNNFNGEFPSSLSKLEKLTKLDLSSNNNFSGTIPTSLGNLTQLTELYLSQNNFSGTIPTSLGNLTELTKLYLSQNNFSGTIPTSLGSLTELTELDLSENNFNGTIPTSLEDQLQGPIPSNVSVNPYSSLVRVWLSYNLLKGSVPSWIFTLPKLEELDLGGNKLDGTIEEFRIGLSQLTWIDISNNELHGPFPKSIFGLKNLRTLWLDSNKLIDSIDQEMISKLQNLAHLDLSYNNITFSPNTDANFTLPVLLSLQLASCNINEIPNFIKNSNQLTMVDLSNNNIHGHIPEWFWSILMPNAHVFVVSNNNFTGEIPSSLCNMNNLTVLDLSNNTFRGSLPKCLGNFSDQIMVLNLGQNNFNGKIPTTFASAAKLTNLGLNGNQLEGELPRSLSHCKNLEILDVGNNKINGTFPYWLETLPLLHVLVLRSNMFHGSIIKSRTKSPFPKLRILDLSHNAFTGALPSTYFKTMKAMMGIQRNELQLYFLGGGYYQTSYHTSVKVTMKGYDFELMKILNIFATIDLSSNSFEGRIPKSIGRLEALKGLNVSHNKLNGEIPSSVGNLTSIEWLDLSSNQLIGEIPIELVGLTYLEVLNLSRNQLVGPIPTGKQFNTFENSSYAGNLGLCGFPLSKLCSSGGPPQPSTPTVEQEDESIFELEWQIVMIGYGCGTIIGMGIGYLVFRYGKPKCIARLANGTQPWKGKRSRGITRKRAGRRN